MSEPAFDELLRRLAEADVEFVVVGVAAGGRVQQGEAMLGSQLITHPP